MGAARLQLRMQTVIKSDSRSELCVLNMMPPGALRGQAPPQRGETRILRRIFGDLRRFGRLAQVGLKREPQKAAQKSGAGETSPRK